MAYTTLPKRIIRSGLTSETRGRIILGGKEVHVPSITVYGRTHGHYVSTEHCAVTHSCAYTHRETFWCLRTQCRHSSRRGDPVSRLSALEAPNHSNYKLHIGPLCYLAAVNVTGYRSAAGDQTSHPLNLRIDIL